jgi:SAM-dependent methyltransferase
LLTQVKPILKKTPILGPALQQVARFIRKQPVFHTSAQYWEDRYRAGGNSGAGSYNRLAQFKADVLNDFVHRNQIISVIEFGCGDGAQLELADYPSYTGVDISAKAVDMCRRLYGDDPGKAFFTTYALPSDATAELALSLDVIYHLVEDSVFDSYMCQLFKSANRFVIIYASNKDQEWTSNHVRHRKFTNWVEQNSPDWSLVETIRNKYPYDPSDEHNTSFADFYIFHLTK